MAINTHDRRSSALGCGLPFVAMLPLPDATVSKEDRRQALWMYRGLESEDAIQFLYPLYNTSMFTTVATSNSAKTIEAGYSVKIEAN